MIRMNGQVKTNQLGKLLIAKAQHRREVCRPVFVRIDCADRRTATIQITVDHRCNGRQFGDQSH